MALTTVTVLVSLCFGQSGLLAFISGDAPSSYQLHLLHVDTGKVHPLGQGNHDAYPQWSPDGRTIAYQSKQPNGTGIRLAHVDDLRDTGLDHTFIFNYRPVWSPSGKQLAYAAQPETSPLPYIVVRDMDSGVERIWGGEQQGLITPVWLSSTDLMKALDPEDHETAQKLGLFELKAEADTHGVIAAIGLVGIPSKIRLNIFIVTLSRAVPLLPFLIPESERYVHYKVQPDHKARQIAFESNDGGDREIFVLGRRGIINVSNHPAADWNPSWSPDDNWIVFESFRSGRRGIYTVLTATANVSPVHVGKTYDCWAPEWSPDGQWIVFVSDKPGIPQLFLVRPNGEDLRQVTFGPTPALAPTWRPKATLKEKE